VKTAVNGTDAERWDHYPYGETWVPGAPGDQHRYTGHLRDAESGNDFAGARYYSNIRGRWLSVDPVLGDLANPQRLNRYGYVLNDPINYLDPDGKQEEPANPINPDTPYKVPPVVSEATAPSPSWATPYWVFGPISAPQRMGIGRQPGEEVQDRPLGLEYMREVIEKYNLSGLSHQLILCQAYRESSFKMFARNDAVGATGLMQVTKKAVIDVWSGASFRETHGLGFSSEQIERWFEQGGVMWDPRLNILTATAYLGILLSDWSSVGGDVWKALDQYSGHAKGYADRILECEKRLQALQPGEDPMAVLRQVHAKP
jgi:RHS repeat-associated protein